MPPLETHMSRNFLKEYYICHFRKQLKKPRRFLLELAKISLDCSDLQGRHNAPNVIGTIIGRKVRR